MKFIERLWNYYKKYDFEAAEYYYNQISGTSESYNLLHYDFAKGLILRGRNVDDIEKCLSHITSYFDRANQKLCWDGFYYKISIYLQTEQQKASEPICSMRTCMLWSTTCP